MVETVNKNDGGRDLSTPAEQALRPGAPESRTPPSTSNLKFGTTLGAVTTAAALSGATFASIKGALNAKKSLGTLTSSLTSAAADFDTTSNRLLSGQTYLKDTSVFGMDSTAKVSDGGFYSASDLVQFSSMKPGKAIAGTAAAAAVAGHFVDVRQLGG